MSLALKSFTVLAAAAMVVTTAPLAAQAAPAATPAASANSCFYVRDWQGSTAPSDDTLLLRVNGRDVYKVDVGSGAKQLDGPGAYLISVTRGAPTVCKAIDLDLVIASTGGFRTPLIAKSIVKLTPAEIAAIPKRYQP